MRRLFQHEFIMTRLMSMVRLQTSSPDKDNENENSNLKAQITIMKKIHSDRNTLRHGGLTTLLNKHAIGLPQPTNAKKQNKTRTLKETTKFQGEKATSPSIIHTPEETTGRQPWNHWMESLNGSTSPRKTTRSSMDFTSQLSHLTAPHWAWKDGYGEYGRGMDMGMYEWTLFWYLWQDLGFHLHYPTLTPCTDSAESSNLSSNFASMDIINVRVTVDICLGGWINLFCIHWKVPQYFPVLCI